MSNEGDSSSGGGCLIVLCLLGAALYGGYQWLESDGYISHTVETVITAQNNWFVGESKECTSPIRETPFTYVSCDGGPEHQVRITFYGREKQGGNVAVWNCKRNDVSFMNDNAFTCKQTGYW
jgi:hypothetical protein